MSRVAVFSTLLACVLGGAPVTAAATAAAVDDQPERASHAHILVLGIEVVPGSFPPVPASVKACIDLAANEPVPALAHHVHLHRGFAGEQLFEHSGNIVIPTAPYVDPAFGPVPWDDCAGFLAMFGLEGELLRGP